MTRTFVLLLACACGAMLPAGADAQRFRPSLETTLGVSAGGGGTYTHRTGIAVDVLLSAPVRETPAGTLVVALAAGATGALATDDVCAVSPDGGCFDSFPVLGSVGAMAGVQRGSAAGPGARLLAGPAYFFAEDGRALGLRGRLDATTAPLFHVSFVASLGASVLPGFEGETLTVGSVGLGVRIQ